MLRRLSTLTLSARFPLVVILFCCFDEFLSVRARALLTRHLLVSGGTTTTWYNPQLLLAGRLFLFSLLSSAILPLWSTPSPSSALPRKGNQLFCSSLARRPATAIVSLPSYSSICRICSVARFHRYVCQFCFLPSTGGPFYFFLFLFSGSSLASQPLQKKSHRHPALDPLHHSPLPPPSIHHTPPQNHEPPNNTQP